MQHHLNDLCKQWNLGPKFHCFIFIRKMKES